MIDFKTSYTLFNHRFPFIKTKDLDEIISEVSSIYEAFYDSISKNITEWDQIKVIIFQIYSHYAFSSQEVQNSRN